MQTSHVPSDLSSFDLPNPHSVFKRVANLVLLIAMLVLGVNIWLVNSHYAEDWHQNQRSQLGNSLLSVTSDIVKHSMLNQDQQQLDTQLQALAQDNNIVSVSLYNQYGEKLNMDDDHQSLLSQFHSATVSPLVFVKPIEHKGKLIGYLQILLSEEHIMAYHQNYQQHIFNQLLLLMMFAVVIGFMLARVFYKFRYKTLLRIR